MKPKKHAFVPAIDGRLEDRIVLNGARGGIVVNLPGGGRSYVPKEAILTTKTYNNVLININKAVMAFGSSRGTDAAYTRVTRQVSAQLGRIPYARQDGLIDYVASSIQFYAPSEARVLYRDIRTTLVSYLSDKVLNGEAAIHKSPGHYFSDADIVGPKAAIFNQG